MSEQKETMVAEKSQWVRLLDMFVLGPFMIWYALMTAGDAELPVGAAMALFVSGVLTIVYNGSNWLRNSNWL